MRIILSLVAFLLPLALVAQNDNLSPLDDASAHLTQVKNAGAKVATITASYDMTRKVPLMANLVKVSGRFYYSRAAQGFALVSDVSDERTVMTKELFISESGGRQTRVSAQKNPVTAQMLTLVSCCLSGDFDGLAREGALSYWAGQQSFVVVFVPTDRRAARFLQELRLTFCTKDYSLQSLKMVQKGGDFTEYSFSDKKYNEQVDGDMFK